MAPSQTPQRNGQKAVRSGPACTPTPTFTLPIGPASLVPVRLVAGSVSDLGTAVHVPIHLPLQGLQGREPAMFSCVRPPCELTAQLGGTAHGKRHRAAGRVTCPGPPTNGRGGAIQDAATTQATHSFLWAFICGLNVYTCMFFFLKAPGHMY